MGLGLNNINLQAGNHLHGTNAMLFPHQLKGLVQPTTEDLHAFVVQGRI